jgi:uncharacterized protein involved in exopolysaccharide biosynthesis
MTLNAQPAEADLFDYAKIKDYLRYLLGSVSRHRSFIGFVTLALFAVTSVLLWGSPKTYHAETQILTLKTNVLPDTVSPGESQDWNEDPTRGTRETIMRRDNLVALVRQTDLLTSYPRSRAPLLRLKDKLFGRPMAEEDQIAVLVGTLENRLDVQVNAGTVIISIEWPDASMAYELVDAASRNFIDERRMTVVSPLSDAIGVLQDHAGLLREEIVGGVERVTAAREAAGKQRIPKAARQRVERQRERLRADFESKQRAIADLTQSQRRQLEDLQTQLKHAQKTYADEHPAVLELRHELEAMQAQGDAPELRKLKEEQEQFRRLPGTPWQLAAATTGEIEDAPVEQAKEDLRFAMSKYVTMLDRLDRAQLKLQSTQANFKHRFKVMVPAELPRAPVKPKRLAVLLGSILGGLALAVLLSALRDLRRGLILERWQVVRELGIPILGEIHQ